MSLSHIVGCAVGIQSWYPALQDPGPMIRRLVTLLFAVLFLHVAGGAFAQTASSGGQQAAIAMQAPNSQAQNPLAEADRLFAAGKTAEAAAQYQAIVNADPTSIPAQVGLIRADMMM